MGDPKEALILHFLFPANSMLPIYLERYSLFSLLQPKKDLSRFVKWPKYVRIQRQRKILYQRLSIPPAINQFSAALEKSQAVELFKLLNKYTPENKAEKNERREKAAEAGAEQGAPPPVLKFGLKHVTSLIEDKKARLVVIASDVDPIELVVWMPALCRKMGVPYCIVKNTSRLGTLVHQKQATCVALKDVKKEDEATLKTLVDSFQGSFTDNKLKWTRANKPVMGLKTQMRLQKRQEAMDAELAKKRKTGAI